MRLLPEASSYVIFELAGELAGFACMVGALLRPVLVELRGEVDRVGIRFRPGMASLLGGLVGFVCILLVRPAAAAQRTA